MHKILPELREKMKIVNERTIYKLLYPLAKHKMNDELEDILTNDFLAKMR